MEGSESAINRVGRAMWTVWGYLTGAVARYLRPEVTNEEAQNARYKQADAVPISTGYKELKEKEEEEERSETKGSERKTREALQCPSVRVRAAAVQWEKAGHEKAHDGHEVKGKNKHPRASSEDADEKSGRKKGDEKPISGSEEADGSVERSETSREQTKKQEEERVKREFVETEEEPIQREFGDQDLLTKGADLNVERRENSREQRREEEEEDEGVEMMKRARDETEEEADESSFLEQGVLGKEAGRQVERKVDNQEQESEQEEKEECVDTVVTRENDETEEEPIKSDFIHQVLLARNQEDEGVEITQRPNDETGEEPDKSRFVDRGLLLKETDLNVERKENNQEQEEEEEEECDGIMKRENDETEEEEEPVESECIAQGILTKESDVNVEQGENSEEQRRKQEEEEEGVDEILRRENVQPGGQIKCEFLEQGILAKEADLNVERNENSQDQSRKSEEEEEEEEGVDGILRREYDETEEEPIKSNFTDQDILAKEADLNVERNETSQDQRRKSQEEEEEEEEEGVDGILRREYDETEEKPIKSEFVEQGLLANEADLSVERNEEEPGEKEEQKERCVDIMKRKNDETEEGPINKVEFIDQGLLKTEVDLNVERIEERQEQGRKPEEVEEEVSIGEYDETEEEPTKRRFNDPEEQASLCEMGNQDSNEPGVAEHDNQASKSQLVDVGLFTWEGGEALNDDVMQDVEMTETATPSREKKGIEVDDEDEKQETVGKEKDGYHGGFLTWEQSTGTNIVQGQEVSDTGMPGTFRQVPNKVNDRGVEAGRELSATAPTENDEMHNKAAEPSAVCEDGDNGLDVRVKSQQLEPSKGQKATSEVDLNVDLGPLEETQDRKGSEQPAVVTKRDVKGVITRPETGTGNRMETVETTSEFRAEVAAVDVKKSAERETGVHEQPIDREEVALQEIMGQCVLEQESLLEESADTRVDESSVLNAPFSEITSVPPEQVDGTALESVDETPSSPPQELEECSSEAQLQVEAKSSSPEHAAEMSETRGEVTGMSDDELEREPECEVSLEESPGDESALSDTPLQDQTNPDGLTAQDSAAEASSPRPEIGLSERVPESESEQETPKMQRDSPDPTEEQERTDEPETGLLAEIRGVTSCLGVVEEISGSTSETSEWESSRETQALETEEHRREPESHEEASESNTGVKLLNEDKEPAAEIRGVESMLVDSEGGETESAKELEEPMAEEDEEEKCALVFSESGASKGHEDKAGDGESVVDGKEGREGGGRPALKRGFENITGRDGKDKPPVLTDLSLPSQVSLLDFAVQKSKIAVKNPLVRPPKDPRTLINMASVEPSAPPRPSQPSFLKASRTEGASVPSKGAIGFKLPGLGAGFPALRKTEAGKKIRDGEDSESVTSQKPDSVSQPADDNVKHETSPHKPKWTPPRQPGMGSPLMMAELKSKLKKPVKE